MIEPKSREGGKSKIYTSVMCGNVRVSRAWFDKRCRARSQDQYNLLRCICKRYRQKYEKKEKENL